MSTIADLPASAKRLFRETKFPSWDLRTQKLTADAVWMCDAADVVKFLQAAAGKPEVIAGITRVVPLAYPDFGGNTGLYCTRIEPEGFGHNQSDFYSHARIKVHFESYPFALDGNQPLLTVDFEEGGRQVSAPASAFIFPDDGSIRPAADVGLHSAGMQFSITSYFLPSPIRTDVYATLAGCVNQDVFLGFPVGCVLYTGMRGSATQNIMGQVSNTITHGFHYSRLPWNYEVLPGGNTWRLMAFNGGTDTTLLRYPLDDLTKLYY